MIDIGKFMQLNVADGVSISDLVEHPERHHWKLWFKFPHETRDAFATPTGKKYGRSISFAELYYHLGSPFLEAYFNDMYQYGYAKTYGDDLITWISDDIGVQVDTLKTEAEEVYKINEDVKERAREAKRAERAVEKYEEEYELAVEGLTVITADIPRTSKGNFDRRTKAYKENKAEINDLTRVVNRYSSLYKQAETARKRKERADKAKKKAEDNLKDLKKGTLQSIRQKYIEEAEYFTSMVKEDIVSFGMSGELPMQNIPLKESTILKRLDVGLNAYPRFWATGQLIESVIVTLTLE